MKRIRFPIDGVVYHSPEETNHYVSSGAWRWTTLGDELRLAAQQAADTAYIIADDGILSFGDVDRTSESVAASMLDMGLRPGDSAIFQVGNVKELIVALFGCFKAGILPVCTLVQHRNIEISQLAKITSARAYVVQADISTNFDQLEFARRMIAAQPTLEKLIVLRGGALPGEYALDDMMIRFAQVEARFRTKATDPLPGDVAMLQLSGGSTGLPKIIPRMHAEYLGAAHAWNMRQGLSYADISLWALPLIHNAGMIMMLMPSLLARRPLVIRSRFEIDDFLATIESHKVTYTGSIGPIAPRIIEHPQLEQFNLSSLRTVFTLARAGALELRTGVPAQLTYGITEGMLLAAETDSSPQIRLETMGWPVGVGDEVRLIDPDSEAIVPVGGTGEFCFRGPHSIRGYFAAAQENARSFLSDGFFRSGDIMRSVEVDGKLCYVFQGRLRDNINRGGEKFGAEEVEALVAEHPAITDVRIVAMPDRFLGERACAFVILKPLVNPPTVEELGAFLTGRGLAKFKLPERIEPVDQFPVTRVGKVDKAALRAMIAGLLER